MGRVFQQQGQRWSTGEAGPIRTIHFVHNGGKTACGRKAKPGAGTNLSHHVTCSACQRKLMERIP